jgi:hypothetical protein
MKPISICLAFLFFFETIPLNVAFAEDHEKEIAINEEADEVIDHEIAEAIIQGKADAEEDMNAMDWTEARFFGCPLGYMAANEIEPTPKLEKLEGKSVQYIDAYTKAYEKRVIELHQKNALECCTSSSLVIVGIFIIVFVIPLSGIMDQL